MRFSHVLCTGLVLIFVITAGGQSKSTLTGRTFKNPDLGLTYTIPTSFVAEPDSKLMVDPTGRTRLLLVLWDNPRHTPLPRVALLYDTKVAHVSSEAHALRYLGSAPIGQDYKVSAIRKVQMGGASMWRMD